VKRQGFGFAGLRHYAQDSQVRSRFEGYDFYAGKRAGVKMPPSPSTASGKARRNRTFVHIEKGVKMMQ